MIFRLLTSEEASGIIWNIEDDEEFIVTEEEEFEWSEN